MTQTVNFKIRNNTYNVNVEPTIENVINIEAFKIEYSKGYYGKLARTGTKTSEKTLDRIDMIAYLTVLMPKEFFDDLKCPDKNLINLTLTDSEELLKAFKEQLLPHIKNWETTNDIETTKI